MPALYVVLALAAAAAVYLAFQAFRAKNRTKTPSPESILLEEATVTEPIAPGLEGRAEIRKGGAEPLSLRVRATDSNQAFARGDRVRVIDFREGCGFIESADEEHLVH
jgi:membrane protein implicated in regulation of membrane protease activity